MLRRYKHTYTTYIPLTDVPVLLWYHNLIGDDEFYEVRSHGSTESQECHLQIESEPHRRHIYVLTSEHQ